MNEWNKLNQLIQQAGMRHGQISSIFAKFSKLLSAHISRDSCHIKGIIIEVENECLTVKFAGRTVLFVFTSPADGNGILSGKVTCYLEKTLPERVLISLGSFRLGNNGETDIVDADSGDKITIDDELPALYVVMLQLREALKHPC